MGDRRRRLGAWYTPKDLVAHVVENTLPARLVPGQVVSVLDPACGDGRFLFAAAEGIRRRGGVPVLTGVDVDPDAIQAARRYPDVRDAELICADTLAPDALRELSDRRWDIVVGNPPFLTPLSAQVRADTDGQQAADLAGGQYADIAVRFLSLAVRVCAERGGRVGFVMPLSVLASRDAAPAREEIEEVADIRWLWWSPTPVFDAQIVTCAIGLVRRGRRGDVARHPVLRSFGPDFSPVPSCELPTTDVRTGATWAELIADDFGVPSLPDGLDTDGELVDHAHATADFRDQYYGLVDAVVEDVDLDVSARSVPLVTTGLIDPGVCRWGSVPVRFAKRRFRAPMVDVSRLTPEMAAWVDSRAVPKVMVATQTSVVEAVADPAGAWLPAVPVISVRPLPSTLGGADHDTAVDRAVWEAAAVLTSPVASVFIARRAAGTGMSARVVRVTAGHVNAVPWPAGSLTAAVASLRAGDLEACGAAVMRAYGLDPRQHAGLLRWWSDRLRR